MEVTGRPPGPPGAPQPLQGCFPARPCAAKGYPALTLALPDPRARPGPRLSWALRAPAPLAASPAPGTGKEHARWLQQDEREAPVIVSSADGKQQAEMPSP